MSTKNIQINNYIKNVCSFIKNKKVHKEIGNELQSHIQDLIDDYISSGMTEEESINKALLEMGPANIIGIDLNKAHKTNSDWMLLLITSALILFGLYTLTFIQRTLSSLSSGIYSTIALKSAIILLISVAISLFFIKIDFRSIQKYSKHIYFLSIFLMITAVFFCPPVNGIRNFLSIGPFSFNILDIVSLLLIISLAGIFDNYNWNNKKSLFKGIALACAPCLFMFLIPSISTIIVYMICASSILILSGFKVRYVVISLSSLTAIFFTYIFSAQYRIDRLFAFLTPLRDPNGSGYIYKQIFNLMNSAKILGNPNSSALSSLPEAHTNLVLTSVVYSFGWLITIILFAVIIAFIGRILFVGKNVKSSYGKLLSYGICSLFASQFILCSLSSLCLLPSLNLSMPFISYGGTRLLVNILAISLVNNIYKNRNTPFVKAI